MSTLVCNYVAAITNANPIVDAVGEIFEVGGNYVSVLCDTEGHEFYRQNAEETIDRSIHWAQFANGKSD